VKNEIHGLTRRDALKLSAGLASGLSLGSLMGCSGKKTQPRNIIFLVTDGMSAGVPSLAEPFSQLVRGKETIWHQLSTNPKVTHGLFDMASMDTLVTDSAAAASAWGSGQRVPNRVLNQYPDGVILKPLCPLLKEHGILTGLVTTSRMTHATPAGLCASVPHRDYEDEIAPFYLNKVDVLLGGGSLHFDKDYRNDGRDLSGEFSEAGYTLVSTRQELLQASGRTKMLGLFFPDHLPYTIDHNQSKLMLESIPTLAEMTKVALAGLSKSGRGFFLMVEAARVDHAAHANDGAGLLWEQLAFDDALAEARSFQQNNLDTLLVISSDHGNANPGLNGTGPAYTESTGFFDRLAESKASYVKIKQDLDTLLRTSKKLDASQVIKKIQTATGLVMNNAEAEVLIATLMGKEIPEMANQQKNFFAQLGQILGNWTGLGWTGVTHTADWTLRMALGPGQEEFSGLLKNTDFFDRTLKLYGINFKNPDYVGKAPGALPEARGKADPTG